jgi:hypothetical protein
LKIEAFILGIREQLKVLGVDGRIILKLIFKRWNGKTWTGCKGLRIGQMAGFSRWDNKPSGCIKCRNFFD